MKIVVITESIDVQDSSASKANLALIRNMQSAGFEVIVYHYTRYAVALPEGIDCRPISEIRFGVNFFLSRAQRLLQKHLKIRLNVFFERRFGFSFSFFNDVNSIKRSMRTIIGLNPDLIFTLSKGTSFRPHYALLSFPEIHHKWVANIHDPYPFHFNPRPYNWVEPGYTFKEKFFEALSQKAGHASFPSQLLLEWMGSYFPNFLKTGFVIPHQNIEDVIKPASLPPYFDPTKFSLLHAGNLMKQRSPQGLIEGFKLFLERNPAARLDAQLLLLGPADYHSQLLEDYAKSVPQLVVKNDYVDFDTVYTLQQQVTVNVILESKSEISPFLPGKFPHCVQANRPLLLLCPYYSETRRLLGNDYPYWAEVDQVTAIADLIEALYHLWNGGAVQPKLNRSDLVAYCSHTHLKTILEKL